MSFITVSLLGTATCRSATRVAVLEPNHSRKQSQILGQGVQMHRHIVPSRVRLLQSSAKNRHQHLGSTSTNKIPLSPLFCRTQSSHLRRIRRFTHGDSWPVSSHRSDGPTLLQEVSGISGVQILAVSQQRSWTGRSERFECLWFSIKHGPVERQNKC